jgi:hypothetical protein
MAVKMGAIFFITVFSPEGNDAIQNEAEDQREEEGDGHEMEVEQSVDGSSLLARGCWQLVNGCQQIIGYHCPYNDYYSDNCQMSSIILHNTVPDCTMRLGTKFGFVCAFVPTFGFVSTLRL